MYHHDAKSGYLLRLASGLETSDEWMTSICKVWLKLSARFQILEGSGAPFRIRTSYDIPNSKSASTVGPVGGNAAPSRSVETISRRYAFLIASFVGVWPKDVLLIVFISTRRLAGSDARCHAWGYQCSTSGWGYTNNRLRIQQTEDHLGHPRRASPNRIEHQPGTV